MTPALARRLYVRWSLANAAGLAILLALATVHIAPPFLLVALAGAFCAAKACWYAGWEDGHKAAAKDFRAGRSTLEDETC